MAALRFLQPNNGRVISNFMRPRGEDLTVCGTGDQPRSFCYVDDEIDGNSPPIAYRRTLSGNVGNPTEFTILECATSVLMVAGSKSKIRCGIPLPEDDPKQRRADITKAKMLVGWEAKIDLATGLALSLDYFKKALIEEVSDLNRMGG